MSDTSIISTRSSYDNKKRKKLNHNSNSSCWNQYWFHIINTLLLFIILITSTIIIYLLYKQKQQNKERQRIKNEFKQKHGVANKVLNMITKDGIIAKWLKANKGPIATVFNDLINDMVQTIFEE